MRRQVKNQRQHLALNQGVQQKHKLWTAAGRKLLQDLAWTGWTAQRREELLVLLDDLEPRGDKLDPAVRAAAEKDRVAQWLQTHPGWDRSRHWRIRSRWERLDDLLTAGR
jgi:transposase